VTGRSLVRRNPTDCGVPECDREASTMRRPWPDGGCCVMEKCILILHTAACWVLGLPSDSAAR